MEIRFRNGDVALLDQDYDGKLRFDLISTTKGDILLTFYDKETKSKQKVDYHPYGQYLITKDDRFYEKAYEGSKCWDFIRWITKSNELTEQSKIEFMNSIILFNIYTWEFTLLNKQKMINIYGPFHDIEYIGKPLPTLIALRFDDKVLHVPHFYAPVRFNVNHEIFVLQPSEDWEDQNSSFILTKLLIRRRYYESV